VSFTTVAPALVVMIACFWLAVWGICLLLTIRFVVILVAAAVMQTWDSMTQHRSSQGQP
jgi:hypothetical protein